ncbi:MAG TPA: O-antigen ligase family protein [Solirubrobacterales bacterium]|jgi:hypothetical protein|nr:O-antigen ligase family protein [Solirubrobacterales bacterium]
MEATTAAGRQRSLPAAIPNFDFQVVSTWLLGFGLVVYLGLKGGGFDPLVSDKVGIVVWWIVLAGLLVGAFPRRRLGASGWGGLVLLTVFLGWTALSLAWTESSGATAAEVARVATYLGVFALALSIRGSRGVRLMVAAVGTGIAVIALIALLSRLHPAWFPHAGQTGMFLHAVKNRLAYPLNYWNAVAALTAMGLPLMLNLATSGKSVPLRSIAAASLPAMALTIYFTISRGGIVVGAIAVLLYLALAGDRVPRLATTAVAGVGAAILIGAASQRDALQEGMINAVARHQGNDMLWMVIVVCLGVGLVQAALSLVLLNDRRPAWSVPNPRVAWAAAGVTVLIVAIAAVGLNGPHRVSHAIDEFKSGKSANGGTERLSSASGEQRYPLWKSAVREFDSEPLHGTGAGTFGLWWARDKRMPSVVQDTHSLYFQTLGELGLVGILLLGGFVILVLWAGGRVTLSAGSRGKPQLAAALASVCAFLLSAAIDWIWQIPVLPVAMLLLAAALTTAGVRSPARRPPRIHLALRLGFALFVVVAIAAIAIPLASSTLIRESQEKAQAADLPGALEAAKSAANVEPDAGLPYLQQALVLEQQGEFEAAVDAARTATENEPTNWRNWLVLSRVQAESGEAKPALHSYREAAKLDPDSSIFGRR